MCGRICLETVTSMHWNAGFLVESRCQRCWVATGSGASGRGSQEASSRWANKGRNPQEADSTTNCENRITFSGRRYAHCSVCRYVDPQTCDLIVADTLHSLFVARSSSPSKVHSRMYDCINEHTCTSTFASIFLSLVALGKRRIQQ